MGSSKEFKWIEKYVDIKGLTSAIVKRAKNIQMYGDLMEKVEFYIAKVLDEIAMQVVDNAPDTEYWKAQSRSEKRNEERR